MHDMNLGKNRSKIQTAYKVSPFTKGTCPEPEDAVKRFESRYTPIPAEYRWLQGLFFEGQSELDYAGELGISQPAVHKRKIRILKQLKKLLEN